MMIIRYLIFTFLTIFLVVSSGQLLAQTNDCGTCLTASPDSMVTFAILYLSWEQGGTIQTDIIPWQPGGAIVVACADTLTPLPGLSYAVSEFGDTIGIDWGTQVESISYYHTFPIVDDPALFRVIDSIPEANCTVRVVNYQYASPDDGYQCGQVIYGGSAITSRELTFPVGSGRIIIDFQAFSVVDTLVINAGGVEVFNAPIGTENRGRPNGNIVWENGVTRSFTGETEISTGDSFIRIILDVEDNCNLSVMALSNLLKGTGWQLYVHCCPDCYNPPMKTLTIDTTVCETGTFFDQVTTEDVEISELTQTLRGCDSLTTYNVHVAKPRIQSIQVTDARCFGSADGQVLAFVNAENPTLQWSTGATTSGIFGLLAGDYMITVTDRYGCKRTGSANVGEPTKLEASFEEQWPSCYGFQDGKLHLNPVGGTPGYTVSWSAGSREMQREGLTSGHYSPTLTDAKGCSLEPAHFLDEPDTLIVDLIVDKATCRGIPDGIVEATTTGGTFPYSWEWRDVGVGEDARDELLHGPYFVTATDVKGCIDSALHLLYYKMEDLTYMPTGFSPNGDGTNDYFFPMGGACIREVNYFAVFDRWGELLYEKRAFQAGDPLAGWDGTYDLSPVNPGTYVWEAVVTYHSGLVDKKSGDVTLSR